MPAAIAIPLALAGGTAAAGVIGGALSSSAARDAANTQAAAASHAADLTSKAASDTLAFQKTQAAQDQANFNTTQQANYNQWVPKEQQLSSLGTLVGLPARNIPAYQQTANVLGGSAPSGTATTASGTASPTGNPTDPSAIAAQLTANYKSLGVAPTGPGTGPTDLSYYATQIANTGGLTPQNSAYWFGPSGRIASDLSKASVGGGLSGTSKSAAQQPSSLGSYVGGGFAPVSLTPALQAPPTQYQAPSSISSMIGR